MQVHEAAALVLGDLRVGDAYELAQRLLRHAGQPRERAREVDGRAPPQLAERVVPDHRRGVIEALAAQRLAQARLVLVMHPAAGQPDAVRANGRVAAWPAAPRGAVRSEWPGVDEPEAGCRQRDEERRVLGHRLGDGLAAAQSRGDELVGVAAVALGALWADGLAAVAARLAKHAVGLGVGRPDASAASAVTDLEMADKAHRAGAVAR